MDDERVSPEIDTVGKLMPLSCLISAYGFIRGKHPHAIEPVERSETLHLTFQNVFADTGDLQRSLADAPNGGSR